MSVSNASATRSPTGVGPYDHKSETEEEQKKKDAMMVRPAWKERPDGSTTTHNIVAELQNGDDADLLMKLETLTGQKTQAPRVDAVPEVEEPKQVQDARAAFETAFQELAADPKRFEETLKTAFGDDIDVSAAEALRQRVLKGDFAWLPPVSLLSSDHEIQGAYADGKIYIHPDVLSHKSLLNQVFSEEVGHHLDRLLNAKDAAGDEGEMFRRLLAGETLSAEEIEMIRSVPDRGTIIVDGREIEAETFDLFKRIGRFFRGVGRAVGKIAEGLFNAAKEWGLGAVNGLVGFFENLVRGDIGDAFRELGEGIADALPGAAGELWSGITEAVREVADGLGELLPKGVREAIGPILNRYWSALEQAGDGVLFALGAATESFFGGTGDFIEGLTLVAQGRVEEGLQMMWDGVLEIGDSAVQLAGAGSAVLRALSTLMGFESPGRRLNSEERAVLRSIFASDTLDLDNITIKVGFPSYMKGLAGDSAAFVSAPGNVIYFRDEEAARNHTILVHEAVHVWQFQSGTIDYFSRLVQRGRDGVKDYSWVEDVRAGVPFEELGVEEQAEVIADAYAAGFFDGTPAQREQFILDGTDFTSYVERAIRVINGGRGRRDLADEDSIVTKPPTIDERVDEIVEDLVQSGIADAEQYSRTIHDILLAVSKDPGNAEAILARYELPPAVYQALREAVLT